MSPLLNALVIVPFMHKSSRKRAPGAISSDVKLSDCRFAFKSPSCQEGELLGSPLARLSRGGDILILPFGGI